MQQGERIKKKMTAPKTFPRVAMDLATTVERIQQVSLEPFLSQAAPQPIAVATRSRDLMRCRHCWAPVDLLVCMGCVWGLQCLHRRMRAVHAAVLVSRSLRLWLAAQNFCICDPNLPDNPIVFASDGFLEMSQFDRYEVLGRNCRFLQVQHAPLCFPFFLPILLLTLRILYLWPCQNLAGQMTALIVVATDSCQVVLACSLGLADSSQFSCVHSHVLLKALQDCGLPPMSLDQAEGRHTCSRHRVLCMQGPDTDPKAVAIIREAIKTGSEATVRILNYRKGGEPFWNMLTIAPMADVDGTSRFFIGVQVWAATGTSVALFFKRPPCSGLAAQVVCFQGGSADALLI